jgi:hypothetical protein
LWWWLKSYSAKPTALAELARLDVSTIVRMEKSLGTARGHLSNVEKVLLVLQRKGVEIDQDGAIRATGKKPR